MPDDTKPNDLQAAWKNQPEEERPVNLQPFIDRRTQELHWNTRWEILSSIAAALFFLAIAWRLAGQYGGLQPYAFGAVIAWALISLVSFRRRIWNRDVPPPDAVAANGLEFYRRELESRRDHLRNAWIWHGPLALACVIFALTFADRRYPGFDRWQSAAVLAVVLAIWTAIRVRTRLRMARRIQQEIDALNHSNS